MALPLWPMLVLEAGAKIEVLRRNNHNEKTNKRSDVDVKRYYAALPDKLHAQR